MKFNKDGNVFEKENSESKSNLISVLVHAVDIGAAGLGFNEFLLWGSRVVQEFHD